MNESDTEHPLLLSKRISLGAIALILAGLALLPQGVLTANVPSAPEQNIEFASGANSLGYRLSMMLALFILGVFALYTHLAQTKQEKMAFAGLTVTVGLLALFLPMTGFAAFVVPAIGALIEQGHTEMVAVMAETFKEPFLPIQFFAGILWNVGNTVGRGHLAIRNPVEMGRASLYYLRCGWHSFVSGCQAFSNHLPNSGRIGPDRRGDFPAALGEQCNPGG